MLSNVIAYEWKLAQFLGSQNLVVNIWCCTMKWGLAAKMPRNSGDFEWNCCCQLNPIPFQFRRHTRDNQAAPKFLESGGLPHIELQPSPAPPLAPLLPPPGQHLQPLHHPWLQLHAHHQRADPSRFNNHLKLPFHEQGRLLEADCGRLHLQEGVHCLQQAWRRDSPWLGLCQWVGVSRGGGNGDEGGRGRREKKSEGYFYPAPL